MSKDINVKKRNGRLEPYNPDKINNSVERACVDLDGVSASEVVLDAQLTLNDKVKTSEIDRSLILTARSKIYKNPQYAYVGARLLLNCLYKEVFKESVDCDTFEEDYRGAFIKNIKRGVKEGIYSEKLLDYDLKELASYIVPCRDKLYKYQGIQNLYDRYFQRIDDKVIETPQHFHMRVAMGLCYNEENKEEMVKELYDVYSKHLASPSTPTLFNSGTPNNQLSSCYLSEIHDSVNGIFDGLWQEARKSKHAGGLGFHVSKIRGTNAKVRGTNGKSSGLIPWLKIYGDMLIACDQGGRRKGSGCAYVEPWHIDIEDFIDLRKANGEERRRSHDINTALWICDLFMERVEKEGATWTLFCPDEAEGLVDSYGDEFNKLYKKYEKMAENGEIKNFRVVEAKTLWKKILKMLFETSHPWPTFKDNANFRYSNIHCGKLHGSNLCTEIFLHTISSKYGGNDVFGEKTETGETAVCNLASVCLPNHLTKKEDGTYEINREKLAKTIKTVIRGLDNVIDINFYPTREAFNANSRHRPIGMGTMGWADVYAKLGIVQDSDEAVALADELMEFVSYNAIMTSSELAKERGRYSTFEGSLWDQDILPIDTYNQLMDWKKDGVKIGGNGKLDWTPVREHIKAHGMRNSNTMAIAPNASIAYILGCEQSIEPFFRMLFRYENLSGNYMIANEFFVEKMTEAGLWCEDFAEALAEADGDVTLLNIPDEYKELFKPAPERDQLKLIEANAARQKWVDQGISFNLYNGGKQSLTAKGTPSLKFLNDIYAYAWSCGLKSTYYLRNKAASKVQKVASKPTSVEKPKYDVKKLQEMLMNGETISDEEYAFLNEQAAACSINAAENGEACEMCQG